MADNKKQAVNEELRSLICLIYANEKRLAYVDVNFNYNKCLE